MDYLMNVQNVLKAPYDRGFGNALSATDQPARWLQLQGQINKLLEQEIEAVRRRIEDQRTIRRKATSSGQAR
jgi:hypothetical protein